MNPQRLGENPDERAIAQKKFREGYQVDDGKLDLREKPDIIATVEYILSINKDIEITKENIKSLQEQTENRADKIYLGMILEKLKNLGKDQLRVIEETRQNLIGDDKVGTLAQSAPASAVVIGAGAEGGEPSSSQSTSQETSVSDKKTVKQVKKSEAKKEDELSYKEFEDQRKDIVEVAKSCGLDPKILEELKNIGHTNIQYFFEALYNYFSIGEGNRMKRTTGKPLLAKETDLGPEEWRRLGYGANGAFGRVSELPALNNILHEFVKLDPNVRQNFINKMKDLYGSGLEASNYLDIQSITKDNINQVFDKLPRHISDGNVLRNFYNTLNEQERELVIKRLNELGTNVDGRFTFGTLKQSFERELVRTNDGIRALFPDNVIDKKIDNQQSDKEAHNYILRSINPQDAKRYPGVVEIIKDPNSDLSKKLIRDMKIRSLQQQNGNTTGIRYAGAQALVSVGKPAGIAGGVSFETLFPGLMVSIGGAAGEGGAIPAVTISYNNDITIRDTDEKKTRLKYGIGYEIISQIPFASLSIEDRKKAKLGDDTAKGIEVGISATEFGAVLLATFKENKAEAINDKVILLSKMLYEVSELNGVQHNKERIKQIIRKYTSGNLVDYAKENLINEVAEKIEKTYNDARIDGNSSQAEKLNALRGMCIVEKDIMEKNLARQGWRFEGASMGVVVPFCGIPFPIAFFSFQKSTLTYKEQQGVSQQYRTETRNLENIGRPEYVPIPDFSEMLLEARYKNNKNLLNFQKYMTEIQNYTEAKNSLEAFLSGVKGKYSSQANELRGILTQNGNNPNVLWQILGQTSGSRFTRKIGPLLGNPQGLEQYIKNNPKQVDANNPNSEVSKLRDSAKSSERFGGIGLDTDIYKAYNDYPNTLRNQTSILQGNQFGAIDYRQSVGAAKGIGGMSLGTRFIPAGPDYPVNGNAQQILQKIPQAKEMLLEGLTRAGFTVNENDLYDLLNGQPKVINGRKIELKGVSYKFVMSAIPDATCTNGGIVLTIPQLSITVNGQRNSFTPNFGVLDHNGFTIGVTAPIPEKDKPEPEQPDEPEEPGDGTTTDPDRVDNTITNPGEGQGGGGVGIDITGTTGTTGASGIINNGVGNGVNIPGGRITGVNIPGGR